MSIHLGEGGYLSRQSIRQGLFSASNAPIFEFPLQALHNFLLRLGQLRPVRHYCLLDLISALPSGMSKLVATLVHKADWIPAT